MTRVSPRSLGAVAALVAIGVSLGSAACAGVDPEQITEVTCSPADQANFGAVSMVLEKQCGTLDCHGSYARPLRIYGQQGLRRPEPRDDPSFTGNYEEYYPGGQIPTTAKELEENARSMCGLEPERLVEAKAAYEGGTVPRDAAGQLTVVRKARLDEKHKGGQIWGPGTEGDQCITNWLLGVKTAAGTIETTACDQWLKKLQ